MISPQDVQRLRRLQWRVRKLIRGLLEGAYRSTFPGTGLIFEELRAYTPGDDIRNMDWNVTARLGEPYIRRYVDERERTLILAVDRSASLDFGTHLDPESGEILTKRQILAESAAMLAMLAETNRDRIGLRMADATIHCDRSPSRGGPHMMRLLADLLNRETPSDRRSMPRTEPMPKSIPSAGPSPLRILLQSLLNTPRRRAVVLLMSDFVDSDFADLFRLVARKHELVAVTVDDPRERALPSVGWVRLRDAETGAVALVETHAPAVRAAMAQAVANRWDACDSLIRGSGATRLHLATDQPPLDALIRWLQQRGGNR
ncbi:DUF58 domain-containing protein [Tuwongella immobilis]|uniref:DUF58 domain-containing protein n=1 Tax=Tuwongella immobilis TaxID=692036 RepID=A0A6C2YIY7_9BACT|nr:DUF58 domain-containing protein [Tuwongella immobilis]VIP01376.1 Uncharacterized protein OS=Bdellovibrio bacteriovorus GN=EP01_10105 PE=4 SV=1: DUF58 [Tuwongella immobilis]VTR98221.1 Uncharacterized protein OS=Bdellovibrio bacteriovorus GN=EP01_10105 PE=4 SV=1: DUF58 [Tuwongella immobilis]